jgi:[heparan sulfate]-glucosamine 3-sulfotransferase 5
MNIFSHFLPAVRWLEIFSRAQILIINGDQLITDPLSQINRVQDFLGIERRLNHENFYFNKTKGFYCLRTEMGDKKCLKETKGRMHPKVNERSISILRKFFVEHNQKFYDLIGEDLGELVYYLVKKKLPI